MSHLPNDRADDRALIARARAGDEDAFEQLVTEHSARVYGALRRFGLDAQEADEVAQQVFVRAWRGLPGFQERSRFSTWLYRIAFNEAQRQLARRPASTTPKQREDEDAIAALPAVSGSGPEDSTLGREFELLEVMRSFAHDMHDAVQGTPTAKELEELFNREPPL